MGKPSFATVPDAAEVSSVEEALTLVRSHGGRVSPAKRLVLEALFADDHHLSADEIGAAVQDQMPDVAMTTIYRNLDELQRLGVVTHSHLGHGPATYQLAAHTHAHFVCEECGTRLTAPDELFAGLARRAEEALGFRINPHHFAILGRCAHCQDESESRP